MFYNKSKRVIKKRNTLESEQNRKNVLGNIRKLLEMNIVNIKKVLKISLEILINLILNPFGKKLVLKILKIHNMAIYH